MTYNFKEIERKWQDIWEKEKSFETKDFLSPKYYVLDMFPYPSGLGLHVGHFKGYVATDIVARAKRMQGFNVLHPMGWDAFGLPAENYAIKTGIHPEITTKKNIDNIRNQMKIAGLSFDWSREINTTDPNYYKWTQWIFLRLLEKGLAYKKLLPINWCPSCKTGLANEEVIDGKCERCGTETTKKDIEQWVLKITDYAEKLLEDIDSLDWPDKIKEMQKNWIGRSEGWEIVFKIKDIDIPVFTTRADTLFGCTYLVLSPEHPIINELEIENRDEVNKYIEKAKNKSERERISEVKDKTGVELKGIKAINPVNNKEMPVFIADYVLAHYGTGAVMAVPAHDERDFDFAKKYGLEIIPVIYPNLGEVEIDDDIKNQLIVLEEINQILNNIRIKFWFNGTYGVSGYYGKLFAKPSDVDCGVLENDFEKAKKEIESNGYIKDYEKDNGKFKVTGYVKNGVILEIGTFDRDLGGSMVDFYGIKIMVPDKEWFADCYKVTSGEERRIGKNDNERRIFLEMSSGNIKNSFVEDGILFNSGEFNGLSSFEAREKIGKFLNAKKKINYKLRDWIFSRQRYWGEPIPVIICEKCGIVPDNNLPVRLPHIEKYEPTGTGESPLAAIESFVNVKCPICGGNAKRETNTMPQWAGSSWYYLRYIDCNNHKELVNRKKEEFFMLVDWYVGGAEHAVLHLLYARFWHKFLLDLGLVSTKEPFSKLRNVGLILASDGQKMSKSKGNVIAPDDIINEFGADTLRVYEMFMGPFEQAIVWNEQGVKGINKFLNRFWDFVIKNKDNKESPKEIISEVHKLNKKVSENIERMKFNTSVSFFMEFLNSVEDKQVGIDVLKILLVLMSPFAPHMCSELWEIIGYKDIVKEKWPEYDPSLIKEEKVEIAIQVDGKVRDRVEVDFDSSEILVKEIALQAEKVKKWTEGKEILKVLFVPNRLINIILKK